jgi:hypothetical protein
MEIKQLKVEEYVYEKIKKNDSIVNIPQEPIFYQECNHRVIVGLFPQFATWGDNSVWEIQIVEVTDSNIRRTFIRTNKEDLSNRISRFNDKNKTEEERLKDDVVQYLQTNLTEDRVNKRTFVAKYNSILMKITELFN